MSTLGTFYTLSHWFFPAVLGGICYSHLTQLLGDRPSIQILV